MLAFRYLMPGFVFVRGSLANSSLSCVGGEMPLTQTVRGCFCQEATSRLERLRAAGGCFSDAEPRRDGVSVTRLVVKSGRVSQKATEYTRDNNGHKHTQTSFAKPVANAVVFNLRWTGSRLRRGVPRPRVAASTVGCTVFFDPEQVNNFTPPRDHRFPLDLDISGQIYS